MMMFGGELFAVLGLSIPLVVIGSQQIRARNFVNSCTKRSKFGMRFLGLANRWWDDFMSVNCHFKVKRVGKPFLNFSLVNY